MNTVGVAGLLRLQLLLPLRYGYSADYLCLLYLPHYVLRFPTRLRMRLPPFVPPGPLFYCYTTLITCRMPGGEPARLPHCRYRLVSPVADAQLVLPFALVRTLLPYTATVILRSTLCSRSLPLFGFYAALRDCHHSTTACFTHYFTALPIYTHALPLRSTLPCLHLYHRAHRFTLLPVMLRFCTYAHGAWFLPHTTCCPIPLTLRYHLILPFAV